MYYYVVAHNKFEYFNSLFSLLLIFFGYNSVTCDKISNPCTNGGTCDEDHNICICKPGISGSLCEIIDDCDNNSTYCGDETDSDAKCIFDQTENKAVCKCNN